MHRGGLPSALALCAVMAALVTDGCAGEGPTLPPSSTGLYVGAAKRDITPPGTVYLGG